VYFAIVRKERSDWPLLNPRRLCRAPGATEETRQERTFSPFETASLPSNQEAVRYALTYARGRVGDSTLLPRWQ
jgi:hypothetical protein